jgi:hypothetical protein
MAQADSIPSTTRRSVLSGATDAPLAAPAGAVPVIAASNADAALLAFAPRFDKIIAIYQAERDADLAKRDEICRRVGAATGIKTENGPACSEDPEYWAVRDRIVGEHDKMLPSRPDGWLDELSDLLYAVVGEIFRCTARTLPGLALQARALAAIADEYKFDEPYPDKPGTFRVMAGIFAVAGELLPELFGRIEADA